MPNGMPSDIESKLAQGKTPAGADWGRLPTAAIIANAVLGNPADIVSRLNPATPSHLEGMPSDISAAIDSRKTYASAPSTSSAPPASAPSAPSAPTGRNNLTFADMLSDLSRMYGKKLTGNEKSDAVLLKLAQAWLMNRPGYKAGDKTKRYLEALAHMPDDGKDKGKDKKDTEPSTSQPSERLAPAGSSPVQRARGGTYTAGTLVLGGAKTAQSARGRSLVGQLRSANVGNGKHHTYELQDGDIYIDSAGKRQTHGSIPTSKIRMVSYDGNNAPVVPMTQQSMDERRYTKLNPNIVHGVPRVGEVSADD